MAGGGAGGGVAAELWPIGGGAPRGPCGPVGSPPRRSEMTVSGRFRPLEGKNGRGKLVAACRGVVDVPGRLLGHGRPVGDARMPAYRP